MARFETPMNDPQVMEALRDLDRQSVQIARSREQASRLEAFISRYVLPPTLETEVDGDLHAYDMTRLNAIGDDGSMLHLRLHRQVPGRLVDHQVRNIAVISHIDDPNPPTILPAACRDTVGYDGRRVTTFTVGAADPQGLRVVEAPMNQLQWDVETVLAHELALESRPLIRVWTEGWEYRRSDRHWEKLGDIQGMQERVSLALKRGLGYAALPEEHDSAEGTSGQFDKKMVV